MWMTRPVRSDRRSLLSQYPQRGYPKGGALRMGRQLLTTGPAGGPVGPVGDNRPYMGMDPSDPVTWVRQYNPQPGMVALLNFDGARPAPAGAVQRGARPHLWWPGGVAGSSVRNG